MVNRARRISVACLIVLILLVSGTVLRADVTGAIQGTVHDRSGAVVAGASITATNVQTNLKQETTSATDGTYHMLALPAGTYKLTVLATGFRSFNETGIEVKVNDQ